MEQISPEEPSIDEMHVRHQPKSQKRALIFRITVICLLLLPLLIYLYTNAFNKQKCEQIETFKENLIAQPEDKAKQLIKNVKYLLEQKKARREADQRIQIEQTVKKDQANLSLQQMKQKYPNLIVKQHNKENTDKNFQHQFPFPLDIPDNELSHLQEKSSGVFDRIQVASQLDFVNLTSKINFKKLEKDIVGSLAHQVLSFQTDEKRERKKEWLIFNDSNLEKDIKKMVDSVVSKNQMDFASTFSEYIDEPEARLMEFLHYDKKYKIGSNADELPICLYSASYNIFSKGKYRLFFESLERQNYSNFHMVYVDDNSRDGSAYRILEHLNATGGRLNNRVQVVHNLQHMGALANMFFWIKKYCNEDDVVIIVDGDDSLAGTQTFQVLNALYRDPNLWYIYSRYLNHYPATGLFRAGIASSPLRHSTANYRTALNVWVTSHLRTFRQKLMKAVPLQHNIEYHLNPQTKIATPSFYDYAPDRFQVYSHLELAGDDRVKHITDPLYLYDPTIGANAINCYRQHEYYDEFKSRVKTPLQRLKSFSQAAKYVENYHIPPNILSGLQIKYENYSKCGEKTIYR